MSRDALLDVLAYLSVNRLPCLRAEGIAYDYPGFTLAEIHGALERLSERNLVTSTGAGDARCWTIVTV